MNGGSVERPTLMDWAPTNFMTDEEFATELYSIVSELTQINEYEFPYRIPKLQKRADKLVKYISDAVKEHFEHEADA